MACACSKACCAAGACIPPCTILATALRIAPHSCSCRSHPPNLRLPRSTCPAPPRPLPWCQVATDTRLWLYGQLQLVRAALRELIKAAADRAEAEADVLMPGYTHLQPAQVRTRRRQQLQLHGERAL